MSNLTTGIESVDKIGSLNIQGNIIPHAWFSALRMPSGRTDINGILILSEIVYWHRPRVVRDEYTGAVTAMKKRFKADLLQRSYDSFAEQFGLTKRQVTDAIKRLEEGGLISRVFRNIEQNGVVLSNVLFIDLHADNVIGITNICDTPHEYSEEVSQINVTPPTNIRETYTEITQKTTQKITQDINNPPVSPQGGRAAPKKSRGKLTKTDLVNKGVPEDLAVEFLQIRKDKRLTLTPTAWERLVNEFEKAGLSVVQGITLCCERSWASFKASWDWKGKGFHAQQTKKKTYFREETKDKNYWEGINDDGTF